MVDSRSDPLCVQQTCVDCHPHGDHASRPRLCGAASLGGGAGGPRAGEVGPWSAEEVVGCGAVSYALLSFTACTPCDCPLPMSFHHTSGQQITAIQLDIEACDQALFLITQHSLKNEVELESSTVSKNEAKRYCIDETR